jgi:hypothetical protein
MDRVPEELGSLSLGRSRGKLGAGRLSHRFEMWGILMGNREPDGSSIATIDDARIRQPER